MFRRQFIQRVTLAGAGGMACIQAHEKKTVTYRVKGFSCITCAVGLETMLGRQKGILRAEASYSKANVVIEFDPAVVTDKALKEYIAEMGFRVEEEHSL